MKKIIMLWWGVLWGLSINSFAVNRLLLESPAFASNTMIPIQYTCKGGDHSPPLTWKDSSADTQSFVLIMEDPDAPSGIWDHWVMLNIPPQVRYLDQDTAIPANAMSGLNSWGRLGYQGPCPPTGTHHYIFRLYALNSRLTIHDSPTKSEVLDVMQGHIVATSEIIGLFGQ